MNWMCRLTRKRKITGGAPYEECQKQIPNSTREKALKPCCLLQDECVLIGNSKLNQTPRNKIWTQWAMLSAAQMWRTTLTLRMWIISFGTFGDCMRNFILLKSTTSSWSDNALIDFVSLGQYYGHQPRCEHSGLLSGRNDCGDRVGDCIRDFAVFVTMEEGPEARS
jgi:hypothetical protein